MPDAPQFDGGYPPLTDEQAEALEAFAQAHGLKPQRPGDLTWREALNTCWLNASYPTDALHPHALQRVRNHYGSTWLNEVYGWRWTPVLPPWAHAVFKDGAPVEVAEGLAKWSAGFPPPAIGDHVKVRINGIGEAVVTGYFVEGGWLGVIVRNVSPPGWYVKQNGGNVPGHSFGAEIDQIVEAPAG